MKLKEVQSISLEGRVANNVIFLMLDNIEMLTKTVESCGVQFKNKEKALFDTIKYASGDLRKRTTEITMDAQLNFGDDAEDIMKIVMLTIDRVGQKENKMQMILNFIKSIDSEMNLDLRRFGIRD